MKYEQAFVDAVRATGGNNETRTLIVQGPSTDIDKTVNYFSAMPTDAVANRLMVEVHYYSPSQFTGVWEMVNLIIFGAQPIMSLVVLIRIITQHGEKSLISQLSLIR